MPAPGGLVICMVPPTACTRSFRPVSRGLMALVYVEEMEAAPAPGFHEEARATPRPVPELGRGHLV